MNERFRPPLKINDIFPAANDKCQKLKPGLDSILDAEIMDPEAIKALLVFKLFQGVNEKGSRTATLEDMASILGLPEDQIRDYRNQVLDNPFLTETFCDIFPEE